MARSYDIAQFNPSDGLDPIVTKKLNDNFRRAIELATGYDEGNAEISIKISDEVLNRIDESMFNSIYPVGSIIMVRNFDAVPSQGIWRVLESYTGRYVRIGSHTGVTGGSASHEVQIPQHSHQYSKQVADAMVKVDESVDPTAPTAISTLKDMAADTSTVGSAQTVDIDPLYVDIIFIERIQ